MQAEGGLNEARDPVGWTPVMVTVTEARGIRAPDHYGLDAAVRTCSGVGGDVTGSDSRVLVRVKQGGGRITRSPLGDVHPATDGPRRKDTA